MQELFFHILNRSISAGWLILAVLVLRIVLKRAPKRIFIWLWGAAAVRLTVPFSIRSVLSLIPDTETISNMTGLVQSMQQSISVSTQGQDLFMFLSPWLSAFWLIGVAVLFLYAAGSYWHLYHSVQEAVLLQDRIYQSDRITNPFVFGIFHPKIYLPFGMEKQVFEYVIFHEQAHIQRKDYFWKAMGFLLLGIYWFNPLIWYAYRMFCRDIEFACDETVIRRFGNEQRADYAQALLSCSIKCHGMAGCLVAFGETAVKQRVRLIMNYRKPAFRTILLSAMACMIVMVCFLTEPPQKALAESGREGNIFRESGLILQEDVDSLEGTICTECRSGTLILKEITYSAWYTAGYQDCSADKRCRDMIKKRIVFYLYECSNKQCGLGTGTDVEESGILCTH